MAVRLRLDHPSPPGVRLAVLVLARVLAAILRITLPPGAPHRSTSIRHRSPRPRPPTRGSRSASRRAQSPAPGRRLPTEPRRGAIRPRGTADRGRSDASRRSEPRRAPGPAGRERHDRARSIPGSDGRSSARTPRGRAGLALTGELIAPSGGRPGSVSFQPLTAPPLLYASWLGAQARRLPVVRIAASGGYTAATATVDWATPRSAAVAATTRAGDVQPGLGTSPLARRSVDALAPVAAASAPRGSCGRRRSQRRRGSARPFRAGDGRRVDRAPGQSAASAAAAHRVSWCGHLEGTTDSRHHPRRNRSGNGNAAPRRERRRPALRSSGH